LKLNSFIKEKFNLGQWFFLIKFLNIYIYKKYYLNKNFR
jgi:hypothetical protein